jgi:alkylation response protein AidB-like acyl-CoA dehydrogenase
MGALVLSEEAEAIRRTAQKLVRERMPVGHLRALRDSGDPVGFDREIWRAMAELGFVGMIVPEEWGGAGLGLRELGVVAEECGRTLAPAPWLSTSLLGATALLEAGSEEQRRAHLPPLCAGERILALAHDEGTHHRRQPVRTRAERVAGGFRLSGEKSFVLDGHVADALVVTASTSDGVTLFLVPAAAAGLAVQRLAMVDSRNAARVRLDGVSVGEGDVLGRVGQGGELVDRLCDLAAIALSAEMLGGLAEVFERTVAYLKTRKQFGVPIGSFQALKHRAALAYCEVELTRSVVREALGAVDERRDDVPLLACAAKARASDTFILCANEAVQMHGGIGVTDELDIGLYLKRARVAAATFGDAAYQRDRYARLKGY